MKKKVFLFLMFGAVLSFLIPGRASALEDYDIGIDSEKFTSDKLTINGDSGSAIFNPDTNTLTLDNYDGRGIWSELEEDLTIILKGINKFSNSTEGIYSDNKITIEGSGSLNISSVDSGIVIFGDEDLIINNTTINIKTIGSSKVEEGIFIGEGDLIINNSNVTIVDYLYLGFNIGGDIVVDNSNVNIKNGLDGIMTVNFIINSGNFIIDCNNIGLLALNDIKINGGYLDTKVKDEGLAIGILKSEYYGDFDGSFTINDKMNITSEYLSLGGINTTYGPLPVGIVTSYANDGATINVLSMDSRDGIEITSSNISTHVIYEEKTNVENQVINVTNNPVTGDNILLYVVIGLLSILVFVGYTLYLKKKKNKV